MARAKAKAGRFQPAAGTRRIVPMKDGSWTVHTPDGKAVRRRSPEELAGAIATYDADDRTPGWYSAAAKELGLHDVLAQIKENGQ
jgi:hypothetical protein